MAAMDRREFVRRVGLGLAAGWVGARLSWPWPAVAAGPEVRLALLADAHLKDGNGRRPEAQALARAVAEIRALSPRPDLVLFAGDLAHRGRPDALDLGREILTDLPGPYWAVRGEGDHGPGGNSAWGRRWGEPWFSRAFRGFQVLGLDTALTPGAHGPVFEIGAAQRQWLVRELARLAPATPLIILSHAPLARLFHPWQQWTGDAPAVVRRLGQFSQVLCLHGHVHGAGISGQGWGGDEEIPPIPPLEKGGKVAGLFGAAGGWTASPPVPKGDLGGFSGGRLAFNNFNPGAAGRASRKLQTGNHVSLPATAWPRPLAIQGTPGTQRPGRGPRGCGWALVTLSAATRHFQPYLWQA
jgi:3',5'-cyclic-AMP phosphodiesterase